MIKIKSIKDHKARKRQESKSDPPNYYRCEEMVAGTNMVCGSYCFNTYRVFIVRPDGKMVPEERQICANPRCQKELFVNYDDVAYTIH